ncbi:MAG: hypothetical protein H6843_03870 [Rhodospirillaceae bacterium]|nr:hypothetical protein [Rhodospirillaceae bacterium]
MSVVGPSADLLFLLALLAGLALGAAEGGIAAGLLRAAGIGRAWLAGPAMAAIALVPVLLSPPPDGGLMAQGLAEGAASLGDLTWALAAVFGLVAVAAAIGVPAPVVPALGVMLLAGGLPTDPEADLTLPLAYGGAAVLAAALVAVLARIGFGAPPTSPRPGAERHGVLTAGLAGFAATLALGVSAGAPVFTAAPVAAFAGVWFAWFTGERLVSRGGMPVAMARASVIVGVAFALAAAAVPAVMLGGAVAALSPQPPATVWPTVALGLLAGLALGAGVVGWMSARTVQRLAGEAGASGAAIAGAAGLVAVAAGPVFGALTGGSLAVVLALVLGRATRTGRALAVLGGQVVVLGAAAGLGFGLVEMGG